jgi:subtilisin family serine protease
VPRSPGRTSTSLLTLCGLLATSGAALVLTSPTALAAPGANGRGGLDKHDRQLLAEATARGEKTVELLLATTRGSAKQVADEVRSFGGSVRYRSDSVGYVRAVVATGSAERAARLPAVETADVSESIELVEPSVGAPAGSTAVAGPGPSTPDDNPYMPTGETGAVEFKQKAGRDGTGVVIGVLDSGVDLDHPALKSTTTGTPKIIDSVSATDPITDGDLTWFDLSAASRVVSGGAFSLAASGQTRAYTAPAGTYRARMRLESVFGDLYGGDLNRDGDTTDAVAVLWNEKAGTVLVDSDLDQDLRDETPMVALRDGGKIGYLGKDLPGTDVKEQVPFTVQVDKANKAVNLGIVTDSHGSHVAGITAANGMFGGQMDGQAPGAQIVSVQVCLIGGGCTAAGLIEGMIYAVETAKVDVVNMSIGGLPALNDGNNTRAEIYNRLIRDSGTQIVISAGNSGPGVNTVGDPSVADDVVSVAAGISKATWKANYGSDVSAQQSLFPFSSRGPREDGGFKPTVSAPGSAISTTPAWLPGSPVAEAGYPLPAGYSMFNGTSMSSPQTAGAIALLLSAAKADRLQVAAPQIRTALSTSAVFEPTLQPVEQGWGRISVPAAYATLSQIARSAGVGPKANGPAPSARLLPTFAVSAPVCTEISDFLAVPAAGQGIYNRCAADRGGQAVGSTRSYPVTVTRQTGGTSTYAVSVIGADGAFTAPKSVTLSKGKPTVVPVEAPALSAPTFAQTGGSDTVQRNSVDRFFVAVPEGAPYLRATLSEVATDSQVRFIAIDPYGLPVDDTSSLSCYTNRPPNDCAPTTRTIAEPLPGIWEFTVESRRTSPTLDNPYRLTVDQLGISISPATATATIGESVPFTLTNDFAPVTAKAVGGDLGSSFTARPTIGDLEQDTYEVVVPDGASELTVRIGGTSDLGADLDLIVEGPVSGSDADGDSEESVTFIDPPAGTYTVTVDGYSVPSGSTQYDYVDVFLSPALGTLTVTDEFADRPTGASWSVSGTLDVLQAAAAGRTLYGQVRAVLDSGETVGSADVYAAGQPTS